MRDTKSRDESARKYYLKNKENILQKAKVYHARTKVRDAQKKKEYYRKNRELFLSRAKERASKHRDEIKEYKKEYNKKNKEKILLWFKNYKRNRRKTNVQFRLIQRLRCRLHHAVKGNAKRGSAVRDLGCSIPELKMYLEGQFKDGMSWDNWSYRGWHIDHKIPLAFFDLTDRAQFLKAIHYSNLQPMWAIENIKKGSKV